MLYTFTFDCNAVTLCAYTLTVALIWGWGS